MANRLDLISPPGRIVAGSVSKPNPLDMHGKPRTKPQYFFALAVPKTDLAIGPLMQQMFHFASQQYAQFPDVLRRINLGLAPGSQFAWKIKDGDSAAQPSATAKPLKDRDGHAGCWIISFSTTIAPKAVDRANQLINPEELKTGYYADVAFSVSANAKTDHTAGLYINANFVRLLGYGAEIVAGPSAEQRFGTAPAPQMGSATPLAPGGMPPGGATAPATVPREAPAPVGGFPTAAPASAPAVPAGAMPVAAAASTVPQPGLPTVFPSVPASTSPVPGFAHGGAQQG